MLDHGPVDLAPSSSAAPPLANDNRRPVLTAVLALDLGQTTGWALRTADGLITSGTALFRPGRLEGGGMVYLRFRAWLQELDETAGGIGAVFLEEVRRHVGTAAAHAFGGYLAHLTAWAEALKLPYEGVPVGTIKRHATGKGNAGKDEVIAAVRAKGFAPADDNEADALALLDWAVAHRLGFGATVAPVAPRKRGEPR
jgi:Holliday junction resolvasome RuvABC endonuclease subunit